MTPNDVDVALRKQLVGVSREEARKQMDTMPTWLRVMLNLPR